MGYSIMRNCDPQNDELLCVNRPGERYESKGPDGETEEMWTGSWPVEKSFFDEI